MKIERYDVGNLQFGFRGRVLRSIGNCEHPQGLGASGEGTSSETKCFYSNNISVTLTTKDARTGILRCTGMACTFRKV